MSAHLHIWRPGGLIMRGGMPVLILVCTVPHCAAPPQERPATPDEVAAWQPR